ncbi:MAG: GTP-binding protein [Actinobacteria bacterium]|nr:GTP-binding protein [Actinomycetota bacterium]MCL6105098.1 GTP-binding protein [Actinomycetota bacterium]
MTEQQTCVHFAAIGSVDDGKSTLIGRLLHDTNQLATDQLEALGNAARRRGMEGMELAFTTDGLRAEREQGITIDVAYRHFYTKKHHFIIADCPGHTHYTRNMATGTSNAALALVLVDITGGLKTQTRHHVVLATLFGVKSFILCVNKMDLVSWSKTAYVQLTDQFAQLTRGLGIPNVRAVPVSALLGDNVVAPVTTKDANWYDGSTLLHTLDEASTELANDEADMSLNKPWRLPVQWVIRPKQVEASKQTSFDQPHLGSLNRYNGSLTSNNTHSDNGYKGTLTNGNRGYTGMLTGGTLHNGDEVVVLPSKRRTILSNVETFDGSLLSANAPNVITVQLADELDVSRGDLLAPVAQPPHVSHEFGATLCWFSPKPLDHNTHWLIKHTTRTTKAVVESIEGKLDLTDKGTSLITASHLDENDIGKVRIVTAVALAYDAYSINKMTGSFILIDELTQSCVAAGMIDEP